MTDISDAADLLTTACDAFASQLLPALANEHRYVGLMIANAMAIAARECRLGRDAAQNEAARLQKLLTDLSPHSHPSASDLAALRRAASVAIRSGRFDDPVGGKAVTAELLHAVADWVAISNPKALQA